MIYLKLFWMFFKIGAFTFGGGYAMLPLIQDAVIKNELMSSAELINFVAVSESTPGPLAVNLATYVGVETAGLFGALAATLGIVTPSFIIILILAKSYEKFKNSHIVIGLMTGLKAAVLGLILSAVVSVGQAVFFENGFAIESIDALKLIIAAGIFAIMLVLVKLKKHPILIICLSAILGIVAGYAFGINIQ